MTSEGVPQDRPNESLQAFDIGPSPFGTGPVDPIILGRLSPPGDRDLLALTRIWRPEPVLGPKST
jgi:hypothetical protein